MIERTVEELANPILASTLSNEEFFSQLTNSFMFNNLQFEQLIDLNKK